MYCPYEIGDSSIVANQFKEIRLEDSKDSKWYGSMERYVKHMAFAEDIAKNAQDLID